MTPTRYDIILPQGATFKLNIEYRDSNNALVDLTGYTARMQVRSSFATANAVVDITSVANSQGQLVMGGVAGTVLIDIYATHTATLAAGDYVYDLELVAPGGDVDRLIQGKLAVDPEVTR